MPDDADRRPPGTEPTPGAAGPAAGGAAPYQVLARKHRPATFADLIGQDALVRTLKNAFDADRIAHAFILTGVRGVGKTTTARIVAKGLNCIGPDGTGGPTTAPCGVCEPCVAIAESRHVDVLEMDAASRTGVGDVRELIDGVRYRAASARYKVYVIDEVHMLSTNAFNALLKTLEEPPEHVKFIFATTEIRKVPVTVLSRCQRFDLRRVEPQVLIDHLSRIAKVEDADVTDEALALIARAAEGSVRDALSLLDQAIAHGGGSADAEAVRAMLGLADRARTLDLFEAVMRGDAAAALAEFQDQHDGGADPLAVLRDLAETVHRVTMIRVRPEAGRDPTEAADAQARLSDLAGRLGMRPLTRAWQLLLKALEEAAAAPDAAAAAEMALIRLAHVSDLPSPEELVRRLTAEGGEAAATSGANGGGAGGGSASASAASSSGSSSGATSSAAASARPAPTGEAPPPRRTSAGGAPGASAVRAEAPAADPAPAAETPPEAPKMDAEPAPRPPLRAVAGGAAPRAPADPADPGGEPSAALAPYPDFDSVIALIRAHRDAKLLFDVETGLRLVAYAPGRIAFEPAEGAAPGLAADLGRRLQEWTGARWMVSVEAEGGAPTLAETRAAAAADLRARLEDHPLVRAALAAFPGAEIQLSRSGVDAAAPAPGADAPAEAPEPDDDDWADWEPVDPNDDL